MKHIKMQFRENVFIWLRENVLYLAWLQAFAAMAVSLYFSELMHLPPCILCWYQRILMYPLVIIIAVGIIKKDKNIHWYILPFTILGMLTAFYHTLIQAGLVPTLLLPCTSGVSCASKYLDLFGFITIPLLSPAAFAFITICTLIHLKLNKKLL